MSKLSNTLFIVMVSVLWLTNICPAAYAESPVNSENNIFLSKTFDPSKLTDGAVLQNTPLVMVRTSQNEDHALVCEYVGKGTLPRRDEEHGYWKIVQVDKEYGRVTAYNTSLVHYPLSQLTPPASAKGIDFGNRPPRDMFWAIKQTDTDIIIKDGWNPLAMSDPISGFSDVDDGNPFAVHIKNLREKQIVEGKEDGTFGPNDELTRAAFTKMMVLAFQIPDAPSGTQFTDAIGHWSERYVRSAVAAGMIEGKTEKTFEPDAPLLREEAASIIWRYLTNKGVKPADKKVDLYVPALNQEGKEVWLPDNTSPWAVEAVKNVIYYQLYGFGLGENGKGAYFFNSKQSTTRAEAAAFIDLSMKLLAKSL